MKSITKILGYQLVILMFLSSNLFSQQRRGEPPKENKSRRQE